MPIRKLVWLVLLIALILILGVKKAKTEERENGNPNTEPIILSGVFDVWQAPTTETPVFSLKDYWIKEELKDDQSFSNSLPDNSSSISHNGSDDRLDYRTVDRLTENEVRGLLAHYGASSILQEVFVIQLKRESGFKTKIISKTGDRGIAQINRKAHPEISDEQAFDPEWSIQWFTEVMEEKTSRLGNIRDALAEYNAGGGGRSRGLGYDYAEAILDSEGSGMIPSHP